VTAQLIQTFVKTEAWKIKTGFFSVLQKGETVLHNSAHPQSPWAMPSQCSCCWHWNQDCG